MGLYNKTLFIRIWGMIFGFIGAPAIYFTGFSLQLFYVVCASFLLALLVFIVISVSGNIIGDFLLGTGKESSFREQLASDLFKAKHLLAEERYSACRDVLNALLERDPDFGDALFVKTQLANRTGEDEEEIATLRHILKVCDKGETCRRWALERMRDIRNDHSQPNV